MAGMNRAALKNLFSQAPSHFPRGLLHADWIESPIGELVAIADNRALFLLEFVERRGLPGEVRRLVQRCKAAVAPGSSPVLDQIRDELDAYFCAGNADFLTPLARIGTPFQTSVWDALRKIPPGQTRTYSQMAQTVGRPDAVRAMASANGANQVAIVIPCHRVLGADGDLTGYGGGLWRKQWLLQHEGALPRAGRGQPRISSDPASAAR